MRSSFATTTSTVPCGMMTCKNAEYDVLLCHPAAGTEHSGVRTIDSVSFIAALEAIAKLLSSYPGRTGGRTETFLELAK